MPKFEQKRQEKWQENNKNNEPNIGHRFGNYPGIAAAFFKGFGKNRYESRGKGAINQNFKDRIGQAKGGKEQRKFVGDEKVG